MRLENLDALEGVVTQAVPHENANLKYVTVNVKSQDAIKIFQFSLYRKFKAQILYIHFQ